MIENAIELKFRDSLTDRCSVSSVSRSTLPGTDLHYPG